MTGSQNQLALGDEIPADSGTLKRIQAAQIRIALESMPKNEASGIGAALLLVAGVSFQDGRLDVSPPALVWLLLVLTVLLLGIARHIWLLRRSLTDDDLIRFSRFTNAKMLVSGAIWGSSSWLMLPAATPVHESYLLLIMVMSLAASSSAQTSYRPFHLLHLLSMSGIFVAGVLRLGDVEHILIALACAMFAATLLFAARDQWLAVRRTIELSIANESLLARRNEEHRIAIQARAEAEEARMQADEARSQAEAAAQAKTTFMAAASHDLRQPVHALFQYVEHLRRSPLSVDQRTTIERIGESIAAISDLLNAVLDLSMLAIGSVRRDVHTTDLGAVLARLQTQMLPLAMERGVHLHFDYGEVLVYTDPALLERLLRNLIHNALRYTPKGSVTVRARQQRAAVRVLVADTGIGIATSERSRIFDALYQVDNPARDRSLGLGLGLAIVRDLIALLGLRIRLKSWVGRGSVFAVEIPATHAAPIVASTAPEPLQGLVAGALVLLVDDDPMARDAMAVTLHDFGCRVIAADSSAEALRQLDAAEFPPQFVLTDYRLRDGRTGLQAIAAICDHTSRTYGAEFTPVALVISGDTSAAELQQVRDAGYVMLHKPVASETLLRTMNSRLHALRAHAATPRFG